MSEYQYYEFLAIDRPLTTAQIAKVKQYSSRAEISATSFVNEYQWGDFRGDPKHFLQHFFDVFIYLANWGTRRLMFRIPAEAADVKELKAYEGDVVSMGKAGQFFLIDIESHPEDGGGDWVDPAGLMASLSPIREEVMSGDLRALYIGWLHGLWQYDLDDTGLEPPVPAGLQDLTGAQQALIDFLEVDGDLFEIAAEGSQGRTSGPADDQGFQRWLTSLPAAEKDDLLLHFAAGTEPSLVAQLRQRYRQTVEPTVPGARTGRTVGQLLTLARGRDEKRQAAQAAKKRKEAERRAAEAAAARAEHLRRLSGRQEEAWKEIETLIGLRQNESYKQVVTLLADLREVASTAGGIAGFQQRISVLRQSHQRKGNLIDLMDKAGLSAK